MYYIVHVMSVHYIVFDNYFPVLNVLFVIVLLECSAAMLSSRRALT